MYCKIFVRHYFFKEPIRNFETKSRVLVTTNKLCSLHAIVSTTICLIDWLLYLFYFRSTGLFVFVYALFYYHKRSNMSGFLQGVQFFGYTLLACYIFFLMLGTVSFFASLKFIKYIYRNLKMDWLGEWKNFF